MKNRKRRRNRDARKRQRRGLHLQALESRQMLAADIGDAHNATLPEDVNGDGNVSSVDALMIINQMRRGNREGASGFLDVNADGDVTSVDAPSDQPNGP